MAYSEYSYSGPTRSDRTHGLLRVSARNRNIGYGAYRMLELLRADPNIPTHSVTLLDALTEDGSRADLARIQNPARAARALTYFIHR